MNYKNKHQREDSKNLMKAIFEAGGVLTIAFVLPGAAPTLIKAYYQYGKIKEQKFRQTVYRLSKSGLISVGEDAEGKVTLRLEKKGKEKVVKLNLDNLKLKKPEKWDGLWRIVIFDVPDNKKTARNYFREMLGMLGFSEIQKSIYAHPFPCEEEIEMIRSVYEIKPCVKMIFATKIEDDTKLLNKYGLCR